MPIDPANVMVIPISGNKGRTFYRYERADADSQWKLVSHTTEINPDWQPVPVDSQGRYTDPGYQIAMQIPEETGLFIKPPEKSVAELRRIEEVPEVAPHEFGK